MKKPLSLEKSLYNVCLADDSLALPMSLPLHIVRRIHEQFNKGRPETKAKRLFKWVTSAVTYGDAKRELYGNVGYRTAAETLFGKEGVCGEMAYLYVLSARVCNLKSNYVSVKKDNKGKTVCHACAAVYIPKVVLVDPAYETFGITHKDFQILHDKEMMLKFMSWR